MPSPSDNLVLIGYRGTGKTSLARELAAKLARPWCDADDEIERGAGKTIAEIFADGGERGFRDWEARIIAELSARRNTIIATGGGAILRPANREALADHGRFIWLTALPETIHARIQSDSATAARRPSLTRLGELDEIRALLTERESIYASLAEVTLDTEGKSPDELAEEVIAALQLAPPAEAT